MKYSKQKNVWLEGHTFYLVNNYYRDITAM